MYYYHSDHLGTGTFLSDTYGNPYQFFLNLPFGETMMEQHSYTGDYTNRYKFNGKELDDETGWYYYGARYYNPRTSLWLSVDPLAEKYPSWSPYCYTMNNPINLVDPDGREPKDPPKRGVRIVLNLGGGALINAAADTRIEQIKKNNPHDKLIVITDDNLGNLKSNVASELAKAKKEGFGQTLELAVFSHSAGDGPIGGYYEDNSKDLSKEPGMTITERGQMSKENWGAVDFNFNKDNSIATFYGCNSASWAEQFFNINTQVKHTAGNSGPAIGMETTKGEVDKAFFTNQDVYLRSFDDETNQVLPMFLYTRGQNTEKEVYGNPTVKSNPKK
ncbi:RHS repeat-associated core domain-containing protein [Flavobacterium indicum]|uniref:RHS repeat-associated core domain-containing protein n=1 Tax=Flavobacterium indicum TaxID=312277 RepID=UPI00031FE109|nr:RHS repeat-associated core domain-containing protein [Flavobacterium indicum]